MSKKLLISVIIIIAAVATFYYANKNAEEAGEIETGFYENPKIECVIGNQEIPIQQYPYKRNLSDEERIDPNGLINFCENTDKRFSNSGTTNSETLIVLQAILDANIIKDGSYGMPSPDMPPGPKLDIESIQKRVAIKKISENNFEIFYKYSSCGTNYVHSKITVEGGKIINKEKVEEWSGSFPC